MKRGSIYEGRLDGQLDVDLEKLVGWSGATFHTNGYQIHGHGLSKFYLDNLMTASGIEALPSTRLYELWLEQKMLNDKVAVRVWPARGGHRVPGQPVCDPVRQRDLRLARRRHRRRPAERRTRIPARHPSPAPSRSRRPTRSRSWLPSSTAIRPARRGSSANPDPQQRNPNGLDFRTKDPAFLIGEAAWAYNQGKDAASLPGTIKLGGWAHLGRRFQDQRFDNIGLSLADPDSTGIARRFRGNAGIYGVLDQMIYRVPGTTDQGLARPHASRAARRTGT